MSIHTIKSRLIFVMMILMVQIAIFASNESETYTVNLNCTSLIDHTLKPDEEGTRRTPRPIICIISNQGIETEIPKEQIVAYELWDDTNCCILSTADDIIFAQYVFSTAKKEYQIRIITAEFQYMGYITTI